MGQLARAHSTLSEFVCPNQSTETLAPCIGMWAVHRCRGTSDPVGTVRSCPGPSACSEATDGSFAYRAVTLASSLTILPCLVRLIPSEPGIPRNRRISRYGGGRVHVCTVAISVPVAVPVSKLGAAAATSVQVRGNNS